MIQHIEIPEVLSSVYQEMAISPIALLTNYALNLIKSKVRKYQDEDMQFRQKYLCTFETFKAKVSVMENEENFEWEDDLMDWEFAVENLKVWRNRQEMIQAR